MKGLLILFLVIGAISASAVRSTLTLVQYEPFVFQLKFTEPVLKPAFQLLLNNLYPLNYTFLTAQQPTDTFFFRVDPFPIPSAENLESYQLIFNSPLKIGNGRLGVNYFMLTADKVIVQVEFSQIWGLLAVISAYVMINFTALGLTLLEFLQIYCLIMFRNEIKTMLYHELSKDLLLLNPVLVDGTYDFAGSLQTIVFTPLFLVVGVGLTSFIVKNCVSRPASISKQIFYEALVYNIFVTVSTVLVVPLFFNGIQYFELCKNGGINASSTFGKIGQIASYFGIIITFSIIYLFCYALNPKIGENETSWKRYLKTQQYSNFRRLNEVVVWESWYKRNKNVIIILKRLLIAAAFFWNQGFEVVVLLLEFANIFYIFTVRPFKQQIYMNLSVISRLLMFLFYGIVVLGNLYYSLGNITLNYQSTRSFLYARDSIFLIIVLFIFFFTFYEIYIKCSNLNYQIRLVREENQFKLRIVEKEKFDTDDTKRNHGKSLVDSEDHSLNRNTRYTNFDSNSRHADSTPKKVGKEPFQKRVSSKSRGSKRSKDDGEKQKEEMKSSLPSKLQLQLVHRERADSLGTTSSKQRKDRHKWKKESLLAAILKEK